METYTYQDWLEGKDFSYGLLRMMYLRILSKEDYEKINDLQLNAFKSLVTSSMSVRVEEFMYLYKDSFTKTQHLIREISYAKKRIEDFVNKHPLPYKQTLNGYNGYVELTYQQVQNIYNGGLDEETLFAEGKALEIILELEYLQWIVWFRKQEEERLEKKYEQYYLEAIENPDESKFRQKSISYVWQGKLEEIDKLYTLLVEGEFLPPGTIKSNFEDLFTGIPLHSITPLQWLQPKNLLAYLVDQLYENKKLPSNTNLWSIASYCFVDVNNLKQLRTNYLNNNSKKPKGSSTVDKIIEAIL